MSNTPTDAEIWQMWIPITRMGVADPVEFARAVLAKWGTPPAVAGEPVAWMGTYDKTDLYYRKPPQADVVPLYTTPQPTKAQAANQADRPFIVRLAEDFAEECVTAGYVTTNAASYGRLMGEALSTQEQAVAVPLTDEQIEREWQFLHDEEGNHPDHSDFARAIEAAHGIKGGQHGAE